MASVIKSIPVLKDKIAADFIANATRNYSKKKSIVDFSEQVAKAIKILSKAKI